MGWQRGVPNTVGNLGEVVEIMADFTEAVTSENEVQI